MGRAVYAPVGLLVGLCGLYNITAMVDHLAIICAGLVAALRPLKKYFLENAKKGLDIWEHPCYYEVTQELQGEATSPYERK